MEDYSFWLWIIGLVISAITALGFVLLQLVGKNPLLDLLEAYKKHPNFLSSKFEIIDDSKVTGVINGISFEMIPGIKQEGGMVFMLIVDLECKPFYNDPRRLKQALGKLQFVQDETKVIIPDWEPDVFNYENFDKVLSELQKLIAKIEGKTRYHTLS